MSNKPRNITIGGTAFLYVVKKRYSLPGGISSIVIKAFVKGRKKTTLVIEFSPLQWRVTGVALYTGTYLLNTITQQAAHVNLNRPQYIKACIKYGLAKGWTGENYVVQLNGIELLNSLGYDTGTIIEKNEG